MPGKKVVVIATMKARSGKEAELEKLMRALIAPTRAEKACINYDLHRSEDDPSTFMFHETWAGREELDKHLATEHLQAFLKKSAGLLAGPPEIKLWEKTA